MDYKQIFNFLSVDGSECYSNELYYSKINEWLEWYSGYVDKFHKITVSNGINVTSRHIYSLKMAKRVSEDWASSVISEDMSITVSSGSKKSSAFIQGTKGETGVLGSNNFNKIFDESIELMFALGTSAIVLSLSNIGVSPLGDIIDASNARICIDRYDATTIIPISYRNGIITECAFINKMTLNSKTYYNVSRHMLEDDGYVIYNSTLDSLGNSVSNISNSLEVLRTKSLNPLFFIFKTNIANNIDINSPLGLSIYSNAIDNIKGCDVTYDACMREVITGQRIIMFNKNLLTTDDQGRPVVPQDEKQSYMQFIGDDAATDLSEYIKEFHPELNTEKLDAELQNQLNLLSNKCGLGTNYYNFNFSNGVTATEYAGSRNDLMKNASKMSKSIESTLSKMILEILHIGKNILGANVDDNAKVVVSLYDSIIEDDSKKRDEDRQDVKDGIMSKVEYRAKWYGETIEEAERNIPSDTSSNKVV